VVGKKKSGKIKERISMKERLSIIGGGLAALFSSKEMVGGLTVATDKASCCAD